MVKIYYGDAFLFHLIRRDKYRIVKMMNNHVYHFGSLTILDVYNKKLKRRGGTITNPLRIKEYRKFKVWKDKNMTPNKKIIY